jgi:hypothetical protein
VRPYVDRRGYEACAAPPAAEERVQQIFCVPDMAAEADDGPPPACAHIV